MTSKDTMIVEFDLQNRVFKEMEIDQLAIDWEDTTKIYWIHSNLSHHKSFKQVAQKIKLPDEVIKLCEQQDSIPKLVDTDDTITMQLQCLQSAELNKHHEPEFSNLIIYLTNQFCFTAASHPVQAVADFISGFHKAIRYAKTPCFILFLILDDIVNDYARILYIYEMLTDELDINVHKHHVNSYKKVMRIKQQVMTAKRHIISIREMLTRLSGRKIQVVSDQCRHSLYNLSNHTHMIAHEGDSIRDLLNGLLDQIDNSLMQKMNESIRVLTAFASIFLPLTLITGIYGMNFHWIPELAWKYGYFYALGTLVVVGLFLFWLFKRRKWF